jgi:two-component system NtrC family sensor kinase
MGSSLRLRLSQVSLALLTLAAFIFGILNFAQRSTFVTPEDGASWDDSSGEVRAFLVAKGSPADTAGIRPGDVVRAIKGPTRAREIHRAAQVTQELWKAGPWAKLTYSIQRGASQFDTSVVTIPAEKPTSIENYLRIVGMLYLFIGLFIFVSRWNAPRAVHFYIFCLASFILYSFHYSGKLNPFDWTVYWANVAALLLQPAVLCHFALVFPERRASRMSHTLKLTALYAVPAAVLLLHIGVATQALSLVPSVPARILLDEIEHLYVGAYFLLAALVFLRSYRRAPSGVLRQQLKWVTGGTLAGTLPFLLLYILPFSLGILPRWWMKFSAMSLALIPLCFGYAIIRYRLMDVDIIFKRGVAYTVATAGVVAIYFAVVSLIGQLFHAAWPTGPVGSIIPIVIAALLFQPIRDWIQARLDRFFYRDRFDYRRTLIEFGRTLTNEVRLEPMLGSVLDRISQTFLVDRVAIFLENGEQPPSYYLARSMGVHYDAPLDLSMLSPANPFLAIGYLFFESAKLARLRGMLNEEQCATLEQLDLNYFIPCRIHDRTVAYLGVGKTVDGDYLSSEDVELVLTMADYVAIAIDNSRLYHSLEQKAVQIERLKDFSENIVESLSVGVLSVDLGGTIDSWNSHLEQLIGVSREHAVSRKLDAVLPHDLCGEIAARAADDHVSGVYKFPLRNQAGRRLVVNVSIAPLIGKAGERLGRLILVDDITQRVGMEEQMMQSEKLTSLGLLAAGVAHEVNTPLAVISNYSQMLARQLPADDPRHKLVDKIVKQTFRASEIVNNLLNFSRTGGAEFAEVDMNNVVEETLSLVSHPLRTARINVMKTLAQPLPPVLGSANRLQQVFLNLFLNARDAMPNGGMLEVRTGANNGSVEIEITDTGVGISHEFVNRIFDPFFTTKSANRGTGLGLSVSYGIIKEHAGKIDVRSTAGKGTTFRLEFPVAQKAVHV